MPRGGRLVYVGITQAELSFPHAPVMHRRELTIFASRNALSRDFSRIISLIEDGTIARSGRFPCFSILPAASSKP
jgi:threonine dehydrogenase-like Zn-dependent dehydrogenase